METCGMSVIKYILFFFNLIFAISGVVIIAVGGAVLGNIAQFGQFMDSQILAPPIVLIVIGAIVFIIAFLGCYGAIQENYHLLMAFAGAMLIIFIAELAVGIAVAVFRNNFADVMNQYLKDSMKNYSRSDSDKLVWDNVQTKLKCCGIESEEDWIDSSALQPGMLPSSCCRDGDSSTQCIEGRADVYRDGCFLQLKESVKDAAQILVGIAIGFCCIPIAGIVLACCLAMTIKKEGDK